MCTEDQPCYKTFSFRVKDAKGLVVLGNGVNTVWNYANEVSGKSAQRGRRWVTKKQLRDLTKGSSKELGLPSQVIQEVIDEFIDKRAQAGKPRLRWRASRGPRRALGWIPFTNQDIEIEGSVVSLRGRKFRLWKHRQIDGRIKSGNFSQDARGRWYCNIVCEVARSTTNRTAVVGFDLGHKTLAKGSDGTELEQARFYRDMEKKLADAERRGKTRLVKTINAKVKNRRKDTFHKFTREVVDRSGAVFVGNISSAWQVASGNGKATHDASWSMLRSFFGYKCDHAGVAFAEVNEAYTTQTCSCCKALTRPKGEQDLDIRQWTCCECGAEHDRDRNAATNIARLGCEALGLQWPRSPSVHAGEASRSVPGHPHDTAAKCIRRY
ncbi:RNA-guided endonuclease TnpB family protein [Microvirga sp. VF16]|uniref:RNA-guided endonuclease InsQ/TnpB family protein n=1 Tax=Microvirga sp. VF16 TaxID=2807101 RepID=UPI00193CAD76|nr:RNA-guided endonuclease TnpB family protein [Microvirga sp. VF16]QRM32495.1 transposase [Microvirga sp. VF16]